MTVATEAGYSWTDGKHARILHKGNVLTPLTITATVDTGSTADLVANGLTRDRWVPFASASAAQVARIRIDPATAFAGTCIAIGAHNLGSTATDIVFEHDSNADNTWTTIGTLSPTDDSPILFFFNSITSIRWRISLTSDGLPEVGVVRIGVPLTFQRPFYAGASPARMNRATELVGNLSRTGELLGRSKRRTILSESANWANLKYDWVRANLDGPTGVIQSIESDSFFFAWRPSETQDVAYAMRGSSESPQAQGSRDYWSFGMSFEAYSYE